MLREQPENFMTNAAGLERELVLAVDDNEQNLQLLEEYLWQWKYEVVVARDGREAVSLFEQHQPSLVVLDVMMPVMDGYEACRRIKATPDGRRVPVVMLTALTDTEDKIRALEAGADDFLNKPINREELKTRLRTLSRIRALRQELDSSENIIVTLTSALENKDPRSGGHLHRIASYAAMICERLGMSPDDREVILKGSLLHDLGMIGVPDAILLKPGPLSEEERKVVREHTVVGASILTPLRTFRQFIPILRWHHERWDGGGFPDGLAGDQIPLEAQIVGVANRFDEIRHEQNLPSTTEALDRLRKDGESGAFNLPLVDALTAALKDEPLRIPADPPALSRSVERPRVLVIDPTQLNRQLIVSALPADEYDLLQASDGDEAMAILGEDDVEVVLLDIDVPELDGLAILKRIRANPRHEFLPVIIITAEKSSAIRQEAIVSGADDFLGMPLNRLELTTRIRSLLRMHEYHADLEHSQDVICALALALEAKDPYTRGHSQRVGDLAHLFAIHLGIEPARAEMIRTAGLLHDIGKIGVAEGLLNKSGPLTRDEFLRVIDHPVIGEEICRPLQSLESVLSLIRHHHERYDGRGYPDGLKGDEIPFEVRLISVVDAYDALTSHRSYRPSPLPHDTAMETLRTEAGAGKWDPLMVEELTRLLGAEAPDFEKLAGPIPTLALSRVAAAR
jgi:putative two-component system response regulator